MNKTDILDQLKENYKKSHPNTKERIDFSAKTDINFDEQKKLLYFTIKDGDCCENMQDDEAAFEGWILAIKRWLNLDDTVKVILSWERPGNVKHLHYQRFLYRVIKFRSLFSKWFKVAKPSYLKDSRIKKSKTIKYILNVPHNRNEEKDRQLAEKSLCKNIKEISEDGLARIMVYNRNISDKLMAQCNVNCIQRQLPVGLFQDKKSKYTRIFTGQKSAIDIYGVNKHNKELSIIELKSIDKKGKANRKVGIISELFFYSMVMHDLMKGRFVFDGTSPICTKIDKIISYMLAPKYHPLVDKKIIEMLNNKTNKIKIEYKIMVFEFYDSLKNGLDFKLL